MEILRKLTVAYYLFGSKYVWTSKRVIGLVDTGICPLRRSSSDSLEACIAEPLVAWACYCYFKDVGDPIENHVLELMGGLKLNASSCGLLWERYIIPRIVDYFKGNLDVHPYFVGHFKHNLPAWMKDAKLRVDNFAKNADGKWVSHSGRKRNLATFLNDADADFCIPENAAHPDLLGFLDTAVGQRLMSAQWKLKARMGDVDADGAVASTALANLYRTRDGTVNKSYKKRRLSVLKSMAKYNAKNGMLRIIFLYPHNSATMPQVLGQDVIVILDNTYSPELLSKEVWKFLEDLKIDD